MNGVSVIVPNHGRDLTILKNSLPSDVEFIEVSRNKERSEQRNIGIRESKGDYLLILDSDQSISPLLITECLKFMKRGYVCVYIPEVIVVNSFFGKIRKFEREFYTGTAIDVPRFVRRDCCPEFDTSLNGPEDSDWGNRIEGARVTSRNVLYHHDDIGMIEYFKKKSYYTKSMKRYSQKWPNDKCLNFKYRCFTVFVEDGKWKKLIRHPILSIGILFIVLVRGIIYVTQR